MTTWLILALLAPTLWGLNLITDTTVRQSFIKDNLTMTWLTALMHIIGVIPFFIFFKIEVESFWAVLGILMAGALWTIPFFLYYKAISNEESSRVALLMQLLPLWALILAFFVLGESLSLKQLFAFCILLFAGILAAIRNKKGKIKLSKAFWLILFAVFLWALSDVLFKIFESEFNNFYSAFAFYFLGSSIPAVLMLFSANTRRSILKNISNKVPFRAWALFITGQLLGISGSTVFAYALVIGSVALTSALAGIEPLIVFIFSLLLGHILHEVPKEDVSFKTLILKGVSFLLIICGFVLLYI